MTDISDYLEAYFMNFSGLFLLLVHCALINIFILLSPSGITELLD